jgi:predicted dienelactone hydrolase
MRLVLVLSVLSVVAVAVAACPAPSALEPLPFEPAGKDAAPDPSAFGPFPVGVKTVSFVDDTRPAPKNGDGTERDHEHRTLVTEIWYPADENARGKPGVDYVMYEQLPESLRGDLQPEDLGTLHTDAVRDADPRTDGSGPFPVVMFSHGKGGIRMQSTFYTVFLASHGYVVVSPDHEGDTIVDLLETGDVDFTTTADSYVDRPIDIEFIMDELPTNDDVKDLAPIMDFDHMGVTGHSFGALTTMIVSGEDFRIKAGVAQSPVGVTLVEAAVPQPLEEFGKPLMIQSGGADHTLPEDTHAQSLWDHMVAPRAWESLTRAGHFTYSDLCIFDVNAIDAALDIDASNVLDDGCGPDNTPPEVAAPLIRDGAVGFFNIHLRGSSPSKKWLKQSAFDAIATDEATLQE